MAKQTAYDDLLTEKQALEARIAFLEAELERFADLQEMLHDSGLFGELFNKAADMIIVTAAHADGRLGKILMANPSALIHLEYSINEIRQYDFQELIVPGSLSEPSRDILYPDALQYEMALRKKNGSLIQAEVFSHVFRHGETMYAFAMIRDIAERLKMQEEIRRSEVRYKRLVESLSDEHIFYSHDTSGMITYVSPSITKVLGYSQEEAMRNFKEFLTDHEMNIQALERAEEGLRGNIQPPFMSELYHRDGSTRIFYNTEIPVYDESGLLTGVEGIAHDITDRVKAEEELRHQQAIFNVLVDNIEEVFWIHDLKADKLLYISPSYNQLFTQSTESLYRKPGSFLRVVHPEDRGFVREAYKRLAKGIGFDMEYRITDKAGNIRTIWSRSSVMTDLKKRPSLTIGTALDITERKRSQQEKNLLAAIVENVEDHAVIKDTDLRVIASNPANTRAAGKKQADQMIGKTDIEIYGDHEHVRQYMEDDRKAMQLKKGETLVNDQVFVYPDGRKIHSLVKKFPVYDDQQKLVAVASISRDVTDYKQTLQELFESEQKYKLLINNQGEGIGLSDPDDRFLFVNPKAEEIFGEAKNKLIGKSLFSFLDATNQQIVATHNERRLKGDKSSYELEIRRPSGEKRQLLVTGTPQFQEGVFTGTFAIFRDITDWKSAEKDIKQTEAELRAANAAKDKFFSIIAHDLKNPFNSILGFTGLLMKDFKNYNQEEILTFIKMINEASRQAHNLLENLLNWSRAQTGRMAFKPEGLDLRAIAESAMRLYEGNAKEKNILLQNKLRRGSLVYADENMVGTIIRNLLSNAIKFTKPKGKITLSAKNHRNHVDLMVMDNGVGIPQEIMDKMFKIDENITTTGTANEEGTGLGLVLCQEFARINHGSISVKSKVGKGSTFTVSLPKPDAIKESESA